MRLGIFIAVFPTLNQSWLLDQINGLIERGHDVRIFTAPLETGEAIHPGVAKHNLMSRITHRPARSHNPAARLLKSAQVIAANLHRAPLAMLKTANVLRYRWKTLSGDLPMLASVLTDRPRFDVIHVHDGEIAHCVAALKQIGFLQDPILATFHGPDIAQTAHLKKMDHGRLVFRICSRFTVGSTYIRDKAVALGCDPARITVLPLGLDLRDFPFRERAPDPSGEVRLVSVGRIVEIKGFEYAIRAVAKLKDSHPKLRYQIVGDGPLVPSLKSLAAELNIADRVEFLGGLARDRLFPVYERAHLFTLPGVIMPDGQAEGQGVVLLEAQAFGLPVLTTRAGGMPDCVSEGNSAFIVPPRDVDALAERLAHLLDHPETWPAMGRAGRAHVEANFNNAKLLDRLEAEYERVRSSPPANA